MKSKEQILEKIEELKQLPPNWIINTQIGYLQIALRETSDYWLKHLQRKYEFEVEEDKAISDILKWITET